MTKLEVRSSLSLDDGNLNTVESSGNLIDEAMDIWAKSEAIGFNEFIKDNSYTKSDKGWYQYHHHVENYPAGYSMSYPVYTFLTIDEIYSLYLKSKEQ